jgi:hypothetical protein
MAPPHPSAKPAEAYPPSPSRRRVKAAMATARLRRITLFAFIHAFIRRGGWLSGLRSRSYFGGVGSAKAGKNEGQFFPEELPFIHESYVGCALHTLLSVICDCPFFGYPLNASPVLLCLSCSIMSYLHCPGRKYSCCERLSTAAREITADRRPSSSYLDLSL